MTALKNNFFRVVFIAVIAVLIVPISAAEPAHATTPPTFTLPWSGNTHTLGDAVDHGDASMLQLNGSIVGISATPDGGGYWLLGTDGGVFSYGTAKFYGSTGSLKLNKPVVGMSPSPENDGYRFVASDGGIFSYDVPFFGSMGGQRLNQPIVGMATTPDDQGYWLVASDGGIFSYGDAHFFGSTGSIHLNKPIVGMATTPDGNGYWLIASDGGIFSYGDANFYGSTGSLDLNQSIVSMVSTKDGHGYWLTATDGGIFAYGDATSYGTGGAHGSIVGMARTASGNGYWLASSKGAVVSDDYPVVHYPSAAENVTNTSTYTFEYLGNGVPARWDACSGPIHVKLSSYELPNGADILLQNVIRELSGITGLQFVYDGEVSSPVSLTTEQNNAIEVGWLSPSEYTAGDGTDGYTQVEWSLSNRGAHMFSADVELLAASGESWYNPNAGVDGNYENVLKHELGHAMGLWHPADSGQVMYETSDPNITDYAAGDLQGLADLSASAGCVN